MPGAPGQLVQVWAAVSLGSKAGARGLLAAFAAGSELRGLPVERLQKLPFAMNIIKVAPARYDFLCSALKERGFSTRQHIDFE